MTVKLNSINIDKNRDEAFLYSNANPMLIHESSEIIGTINATIPIKLMDTTVTNDISFEIEKLPEELLNKLKGIVNEIEDEMNKE